MREKGSTRQVGWVQQGVGRDAAACLLLHVWLQVCWWSVPEAGLTYTVHYTRVYYNTCSAALQADTSM